MEKFIVFIIDNDNKESYISNVSPLLWTDDRNKAKIFYSESEIRTDLSLHFNVLDEILKPEGMKLKVEKLE